MIKSHRFCGIECTVLDSKAIVKILKDLCVVLNSGFFMMIDGFLCIDGQRIDLPEFLTINDFKQQLNLSFYAESLVMHYYSIQSEVSAIDTYEDYVNSNCEMIVIIFDSAYLEVYCKNTQLLRHIYKVACGLSSVSVKRKYEDTDERTGMYI